MPKGPFSPNVALYNLRDSRAETQEHVAAALNALAHARDEETGVTGNQVSRWERGIVHPSPLHRQLLAQHFGVGLAELGLVRRRPDPADARTGRAIVDVLSMEEEQPLDEPQVIDSQQQWLQIRKSIGRRYLPLARAAARLYPEEVRFGDTGMLTPPQWQLSPLIDLADIDLTLDPTADLPEIDGAEESSDHVRPLLQPDRRFRRYSHALRDLARPKLLENRLSWRLTDASFDGGKGRLTFGYMNYFDAIDICEAVAHETAAEYLVNDGQVAPPTWRGLHFRKELGDPFDLRRRSLILSINTLTLRRGKTGVSMVLHSRDAANVATSGGVVGVMPAGVFQPSTVRRGDHADDFDLWRNVMREYSEEFLGNPEHDGDGPGADYTAEPLRSMDEARRAGAIRIYCAGITVSALDLWGVLETVAVIDGDVFDVLFADLVRVNNEGSVVQVGRLQPTSLIPFTKETIAELTSTGRLAPQAAFSLRNAWQHREQLF